jgi:hypothetical protein
MGDSIALIGVFAVIRWCTLDITERSNFTITDSTCISKPFEFLAVICSQHLLPGIKGDRSGSTRHMHHHFLEVTSCSLILRGITRSLRKCTITRVWHLFCIGYMYIAKWGGIMNIGFINNSGFRKWSWHIWMCCTRGFEKYSKVLKPKFQLIWDKTLFATSFVF